ncbi:MAG: sigma 54-interacting transcriptional regulator [Clostridiales Family XIII bacterium]|jgi:transcriptional regulator with PAS, ATPase and Fis domain|nr:sigma 54-interacting transcriptional regulator [Clostridiales Family XIII bacterium]
MTESKKTNGGEGFSSPEGIVAAGDAMRGLVQKTLRIAPTDATVLLTGESGTGKELFAGLVHRYSKRADRPFIKINCAAVPETLMESEFFGYESGAFTGAERSGKAGIFELANCGTLFLDEIGELTVPLQSKLLNVLQDKKLRRIGGQTPICVDFRLIAATNQDLDRAIKAGRFRKDLFYLLNILPIGIPPLRERKADIGPLAAHFLRAIGEGCGLRKTLSQGAIDALTEHSWPGNARELRNIIERAVITCEDERIDEAHISEMLRDEQTLHSPFFEEGLSLRAMIEEYEKKILMHMMRKYKTAGVVCEKLCISKATMSRKLKKYGK